MNGEHRVYMDFYYFLPSFKPVFIVIITVSPSISKITQNKFIYLTVIKYIFERSFFFNLHYYIYYQLYLFFLISSHTHTRIIHKNQITIVQEFKKKQVEKIYGRKLVQIHPYKIIEMEEKN